MSHKRNKNRKHHANRPRRTPATIGLLKIDIDDGENLGVTLDGAPYPYPHEWDQLGRDAVGRIIDFAAAEHGPVHIQVTESDGTLYTDIATPPDFEAVTSDPPSREERPRVMNELVGREYLPGEVVDVAVVIHDLEADRDGRVSLNLPSSVLSRVRKDIVLLGRTSGTINVMHRS
ncbi:putative cell wall protein DAN4 [Nocardioidaceae bacterium Broad-1]|nr:putative cell wall protein DAN4 [Nocardioidaceae bacterium Broad-1]